MKIHFLYTSSRPNAKFSLLFSHPWLPWNKLLALMLLADLIFEAYVPSLSIIPYTGPRTSCEFIEKKLWWRKSFYNKQVTAHEWET